MARVGVVDLCLCLAEQGQGWVSYIFYFWFCFFVAVNCFFHAVLLSVSLLSLILCYQKDKFLISTLWVSWKKGECFDLSQSFGSSVYFIHQNQTSRPSLSFQPADLLPLYINHFRHCKVLYSRSKSRAFRKQRMVVNGLK